MKMCVPVYEHVFGSSPAAFKDMFINLYTVNECFYLQIE